MVFTTCRAGNHRVPGLALQVTMINFPADRCVIFFIIGTAPSTRPLPALMRLSLALYGHVDASPEKSLRQPDAIHPL